MSIQRKDDAQRVSNAPSSPALGEKFVSGRPMRAKMPARGKVLCVFSNRASHVGVEDEVLHKGFSLLRARPGIHGYWLAITSRPDVVITDVPEPGPDTDSAYLLDCLNRNMKTRDIPVVAILKAKEQGQPLHSGLQHADLCVASDLTADKLMERVDELIDSTKDKLRSKFRRADGGHANQVDAVFSEIGSSAATASASPIPLLGPVRMPAAGPTMTPSP